MNLAILLYNVPLLVFAIVLVIALLYIVKKDKEFSKELVDQISRTIVAVTGNSDSLIKIKEYEKFYNEIPKKIGIKKQSKKETPGASNFYGLNKDEVIM